METIRQKISFHLSRSQQAYSLYLQEKKYYQALRIYKANREIYHLISEHAELWNEHREMLINYLFHLEDWFEQFDDLAAQTNPLLNDHFVFERLEHGIPFPKEINHFFS